VFSYRPDEILVAAQVQEEAIRSRVALAEAAEEGRWGDFERLGKGLA
jgi:hypothetical protein